MSGLGRVLVGGAAATLGLLVLAGPAGAHVTIQPGTASPSTFTTQWFQVPNERDDASTTKLEVGFPEDPAFAFVSIEPTPGWTATVQQRTLSTPIKTDSGEVSEVVSSVTWTGGSIAPGQFERFGVSLGVTPKSGSVEFTAVQTYSSGEVVRWIEPATSGGTEPEHPAPTLSIEAPAAAQTTSDQASTTSADQDEVDTAKTLGIVGIVVGGVGLIVAIVAVARRRSSSATG
jgi:uncharacterized protein YcnI